MVFSLFYHRGSVFSIVRFYWTYTTFDTGVSFILKALFSFRQMKTRDFRFHPPFQGNLLL